MISFRTVFRGLIVRLLSAIMILLLVFIALLLRPYPSGDGIVTDRYFAENILLPSTGSIWQNNPQYVQNILNEVEDINIHIVPLSQDGFVDSGDYISEQTKVATLVGADADSFFSAAVNDPRHYGLADRTGCFRNREKLTYHVLVSQKNTEGVGYFILNKCTTKNFNSVLVTFSSSTGDSGSYVSDELFQFLAPLGIKIPLTCDHKIPVVMTYKGDSSSKAYKQATPY